MITAITIKVITTYIASFSRIKEKSDNSKRKAGVKNRSKMPKKIIDSPFQSLTPWRIVLKTTNRF